MKINVDKMTRKVEVDNRIPLRNYYRIADNLLRQANIHREEKNVVDLYIMPLRYLSLVSETIPYHRDYQALYQKERANYKKRSFAVLNELESIKPEFHRRVDEIEKAYSRTQQVEFNGSVSLPLPKQETLSRHSFLGPNGFQGQWSGPSAGIKVQYPSNADLTSTENSSLNQAGQYDAMAVKDANSAAVESTMESVLSLDDGRWPRLAEDTCPTLINEAREDPFQFVGIRQPSPPPVLAKVQQESSLIPSSKVADPRPGPAKPSDDGLPSSNSYQHLHVPVNLMQDFLRLARANTEKNLETCGVLAGSLKNRVFHITTLIIPKQESTSDSCQTLNEEEIFEVQDKLSLFPLGWIHTHPSQTCFMSSVDLHTHYSYQIMLPEAIAIVMAPTDESSPHGIFHLSDPSGVSVIRNCQQRGFHPHEESLDGSPIYEHCSHVYMNSIMKFDVVDLR
ncbi:hypothetical protein POTOM_036248 [Populus tomentosa]|uniref:MPN domain-containing protein n=1 Tax=Populus tomentosa TaxID=118781 RepID=A0A8X8CMU8_POPTO|nr:hypothetical protein POTOM_036248 [Populus tomentosa]